MYTAAMPSSFHIDTRAVDAFDFCTLNLPAYLCILQRTSRT